MKALLEDLDGKYIFLIRRNIQWTIWTLAANQIRHPHSMNYYHHSKKTYIIWFDQSISKQLELTFRKNLQKHNLWKTCTLIKFDTAKFYPSISAELLEKPINFASIIKIEDKIINIIKHARKSTLFNNGKSWIKKEGHPYFDVTMESYDGAENCELVGFYLLSKLAPLVGTKNVGLYQDDGLAVSLWNKNGQNMEINYCIIQIWVTFYYHRHKLDRNGLPRCLIQSRDG